MSNQSLNQIEKRAAFSLAGVFAFRMLGLFMLMPVLAIYSDSFEDVSPLWIGLAIGAYGLTQALLQIPMGWLSDKFGRKPIIIGGLVVFAIGSVIAATADSIYWVTAGRALQGMGAIASALLALASDLSRDEQRPKVMAVIGMCIGLSFAVAMLVGPMVAASFGIAGVFWLTAILALVGIAIVLFVVPNAVHKAPKGDTVASLGDIKNLIKHPQLLRLDIGVLLLHLTLTTLFVVLPAKLINEGLEAQSHWQIYIPVLILAFVLMAPMMIVAIKKQKEKQVFLAAIAILSISTFLLIWLSGSLWGIALSMTLYFIAFNFLEATMPALVSRISPATQKGSAMGVFSSGQFLGAFLGGVLGGYLAQHYETQTVFAAAAGIGVIWLAIAWRMQVPPRSKALSFVTELDKPQHAQTLADKLVALPGVLEATVVSEENRAYLKVDESKFDLNQAKQILYSS
ncbi:MFS transporter [Pseudoalteromonas luteoviolacea]|uniref:Membrane protein n=1 Tax=Pseudoalteromonas luteoviolacea S4054 TaxID=1129367 RepID=A0A0F6AFC1_9GAMM|nr:MFS transporter [Pseudoalteromonas luteoviolacea]AOT09813.1 MFS transporter [Pseudoalteromonas luteoviolacea]AOT14725.1 MFS transporter [Pseudoalteromonas luteoviolacea]AOT19640.1 MFS transporter [Pseudoalteromonas luteoviolacea]KKE84084.1 membrane protein [Pseudoalteromonas luteoviolacea S4054]KZN77478.1 membrane protein [Pseudoalteromonas luteoviolacea S4047-1]